ncbi:hypothetical protein PoHVEF18_005462 [Penicillium ochrochloron]
MDVAGIALITGAASGIGRACAKAFVKGGASGIALLDLNEDSLETVKSEIEDLQRTLVQTNPCRIETYPINVGDEIRMNKVIETVAQTFGRLDNVVNAAGIAMKHQGGAAFAKTADWDRILNVNLTGTFFVLRAAAKIMLKQELIKLALMGVVEIPLSTAYTVTKHAGLGLTRTASEDYAKEGLRINAICRGYTETPLTTKSPAILQAMVERVATAVPMERMGRPEDIADGVLYLAGGRSSFVTGTALMVDGGYTQR